MIEQIINNVTVRCLLYLRKNTRPIYASKLAIETKITFSYTIKILNEFKNKDLISFTRQGRANIIHLSNKGKKAADLLIKFQEMVQ